MTQDRVGNHKSTFITLGASNHAMEERQEHDFYATDPIAIRELLKHETFNKNIWEPACGTGHLSLELEKHGYNVVSSDLIDRGFGKGNVDFLKCTKKWDGDIITNPPYIYAQEFIEKSLELVNDGAKVVMFLKIQFLESRKRLKMFKKTPPKIIYVSSSRINCAKNAEFDSYKSSAISYAWYIWEKGYKGDPIIKWFN